MPNETNLKNTGSRPILEPHDHTEIISAIVQNFPSIVKNLDVQAVAPANRGEHVLRRVLEEPGIAPETKAKVRQALDVLPKLAEAAKRETAADRKAIEYVAERLRPQETLPQILQQLRQMESGDGPELSVPGIREGIRVAIQMVEDGSHTIYNPEFYAPVIGKLAGTSSGLVPYDQKVNSAGAKIAKADTNGAIKGGIEGAIMGSEGGVLSLAGAALGACAGALAESAGEYIDQSTSPKTSGQQSHR